MGAAFLGIGGDPNGECRLNHKCAKLDSICPAQKTAK
jgi:hypothetical protein